MNLRKKGDYREHVSDCKEKVFAELNLNSDEWILAQGTIYPDTIESAGTKMPIVLKLITTGLI